MPITLIKIFINNLKLKVTYYNSDLEVNSKRVLNKLFLLKL